MRFQLEQAIQVLRQTPAVVDAMLRTKSAEWLRCRITPEAFNPMDVLGHLIYCEQTDWIPRAQVILEQGESRPFDPFDRFGHRPLLEGREIGDLLDLFAALRTANLETLASWNLGEKELALTGTHPEFGRVTLSELLASWTVHDLGHIAQIARIMSHEYGDAVGPWRRYMTILQ